MKLYFVRKSLLFLLLSNSFCFAAKNNNNKNKLKNDKKLEVFNQKKRENKQIGFEHQIDLEEQIQNAQALVDFYCDAVSPVSVGEIKKSISQICKKYPEVEVALHQANGGHTTFGRKNNGKGVLITGHGSSAMHQPWIANKILFEVIVELSGIESKSLVMNNPLKNKKNG